MMNLNNGKLTIRQKEDCIIKKGEYKGNTDIREISIESKGMCYINQSAFSCMPNLKTIKIIASDIVLSKDVLKQCPQLIGVRLNAGEKGEIYIDDHALSYCAKFNNITIYSKICSIQSKAFCPRINEANIFFHGSRIRIIEGNNNIIYTSALVQPRLSKYRIDATGKIVPIKFNNMNRPKNYQEMLTMFAEKIWDREEKKMLDDGHRQKLDYIANPTDENKNRLQQAEDDYKNKKEIPVTVLYG